MNRESILKGLLLEVIDVSGVSFKIINLESNIYNDLGFDSLDAVELMMKLEQRFNTVIDDKDAEILQEIKQILDYLDTKINGYASLHSDFKRSTVQW